MKLLVSGATTTIRSELNARPERARRQDAETALFDMRAQKETENPQ